MRRGPSPLPLHIAMASTALSQRSSAALNNSLGTDDAVQMMRGIKLYQEHSFNREMRERDVIWQARGVRVLSSRNSMQQSAQDNKPPLLLVPSMINKSHILDLHPDRSMFEWFAAQGHDVYLLDWGDIVSSDASHMTLDDLLGDIVAKAVQAVSEAHNGSKVNMLGYCMGGTLAVQGLEFMRNLVNAIVLLSAPWDFHAQEYNLARDVRIASHATKLQIAAQGCLSAHNVQSLFAAFEPEHFVRKFIKFSKMDQASKDAEIFVSVEDWLNDSVDLPQYIAQYCLDEWFMNNIVHKSDARHDVPFFIVASKGDRIVPHNAALPIGQASMHEKTKELVLDCGHIAMIAGRNAVTDIWAPIADWLKSLI